MNKRFLLILVSLIFSLFVYLFYRTENTVVTRLFIELISNENYDSLKFWIKSKVQLNEYIIYSLPEGLWVFSITLLSKPFFIELKDIVLRLVYFPLIISIGLEIFQLFNITNGKFDWWDIAFSLLFWMLGYHLSDHSHYSQNVLKPFNYRSLICLACYSIVYFAHVWH